MSKTHKVNGIDRLTDQALSALVKEVRRYARSEKKQVRKVAMQFHTGVVRSPRRNTIGAILKAKGIDSIKLNVSN